MTLPKHDYQQSNITPGHCGAGEHLSAGHIRSCGLPPESDAHNKPTDCPTCHMPAGKCWPRFTGDVVPHVPPRDYVREFKEASDEICNRLADNLEAIDRENGLEPHDYSTLRKPTALSPEDAVKLASVTISERFDHKLYGEILEAKKQTS